ncbi:hypothetical protein ACP70R_016330 [Stipagrostis hirtigluma subsp. patula]
MIAKSRVIAVLFLAIYAAFAAAGDSKDLPASFDVLQQQTASAARVGFGCFVRCYAGCFASGFTGDYCDDFCERECADEARMH